MPAASTTSDLLARRGLVLKRRRRRPHQHPVRFVVKKITTGQTFRFKRKLLYIADSLADHRIGLVENDDGIWSIYFNTVLIATLDERDYIIRG